MFSSVKFNVLQSDEKEINQGKDVSLWNVNLGKIWFVLISEKGLLLLQELILRDNKLMKIPDVSIFKKLSVFDVSFNEITLSHGLSNVTDTLKELYVSKNEVPKMEEIEQFHDLQILEFGSNRLRVRVFSCNHFLNAINKCVWLPFAGLFVLWIESEYLLGVWIWSIVLMQKFLHLLCRWWRICKIWQIYRSCGLDEIA